MKKFFVLCALVLSTVSAHATIGTAQVQTDYFFASSSFGNAPMDNYANRWRTWLQTYRAISKIPKLRDRLVQLKRNDNYPGNQEAKDEAALALIHRSLSPKQIAAQSSKIYVLKIARFSSQNEVRNWLHRYWAPLKKADIYNATKKNFVFYFYSEAIAKPQMVWEETRGNGRILYHGFYASLEDAMRDADKFSDLLRTKPTIISRELSAAFVKNALFGSIANRAINENGEWR